MRVSLVFLPAEDPITQLSHSHKADNMMEAAISLSALATLTWVIGTITQGYKLQFELGVATSTI